MSEQKEIKIDIVKLALAIQLAVFGVIGLDKIGVNVPIIREIVVFVYLAIIPGLLVLRLRDMNVSTTKTFLLAIGMSLVFVTFVSTFMNVFLASMGFERPLSETPLLVSISIAVLLLIGLSYFKGKPQISFSYEPYVFSSHQFLFLLLLPFVSILAAYVSSAGGSDLFVLLLLAVIALVPLIVALDKLPERFYPLVVLSSSASLVFLRFGGSIFKTYSLHETGIAGVIKTVGIWIPNFGSTHNSLLYLTILHPVFSTLLDMDIITEIGLIGFLIVISLPLIVYEIYIKFFDRKTSILASFLFLFYPFHNELLGGRTGFAVFFLALFLLTLVSTEIPPVLRKSLSIVFAFSIIASHYGTAYYFMILLFAATILALFMSGCNRLNTISHSSISAFCLLYPVLALFWYMYTSRSTNVNWAASFGINIYMHLSEFFSPEASATMQAVLTKWGFAQEITKYLLFAISLFIIIGILKLVYNLFRGMQIESEFYIFAVAFTLGLFTLFLPRVMGTVRIYAIALLILAPFCFVGFSLVLSTIHKAVRGREKKELYSIFFAIFLFLFLIFGSGFVSTVMTKVTHESIDPTDPMNWWTVPNWHDVDATEWLLLRHGVGRLYLDSILGHAMIIREGTYTKGHFNFPIEYAGKEVYQLKPIQVSSMGDFLDEIGKLGKGHYIYLGYHNTVYNFIGTITETGEKVPLATDDYLPLFEKNNKIYENGVSLIYQT